jgi:hypothetical protein
MTSIEKAVRHELLDCDGERLEFGTIVSLSGPRPMPARERLGVIVDALEEDVDDRDDARPSWVPPRVIVDFFDGCEDVFDARYEHPAAWWDEEDAGPLLVEDLRVVPRSWRWLLPRAWWWLRRSVGR